MWNFGSNQRFLLRCYSERKSASLIERTPGTLAKKFANFCRKHQWHCHCRKWDTLFLIFHSGGEGGRKKDKFWNKNSRWCFEESVDLFQIFRPSLVLLTCTLPFPTSVPTRTSRADVWWQRWSPDSLSLRPSLNSVVRYTIYRILCCCLCKPESIQRVGECLTWPGYPSHVNLSKRNWLVGWLVVWV